MENSLSRSPLRCDLVTSVIYWMQGNNTFKTRMKYKTKSPGTAVLVFIHPDVKILL